MITELYNKLTEAIRATGKVEHIDLWNQNVEFVEDDEAWSRPAVFIEFGTIRWTPYKGLTSFGLTGMGEVRLHVVTDWKGSAADGSIFREETLADYELCDSLLAAVAGISGESFHNLRLICTETNHNHQQLLENIDIYSVVYFRELSA